MVAYCHGSKAFFVYGFTKNERADISTKQLKALKLLAGELLGYSTIKLRKLIKDRELLEVIEND